MTATPKIQLRRAREYQVEALRWSDNVQHPGFFHDKRLGKCLVSLRFCKRRKVKGPILIMTTTSAFDGWKEDLEIELFENVIELEGTKKARLKLLKKGLEKKHPVFLLNKEGWKALPEILGIDWFSIILDESRFISNPRSQVSKFFWKNFREVTHRIILTGTPDFKNKLDYFQQLTFLDYKNLPYKDYWHFRTKAFHAVAFDFILKKHDKNVLAKCISDNIHTLTRKELDIGRTKSYEPRYVILPPVVQKAYDTLEKEYVLEYHNNVISKSIYATTAHGLLMRICGGHIDGKLVHKEKVKDLKYLLENDLLNEQLVIVCRFTEEILMLKKELKKYKPTTLYGETPRPKRKIIKKAFKEGDIPILIVQGSVVAHGTDLASAETIIFYSQPSGDEIRSQVEDRIITVADKKQVLIIDILIKDTVDSDTRFSYINEESHRETFNRMVRRWRNKR